MSSCVSNVTASLLEGRAPFVADGVSGWRLCTAVRDGVFGGRFASGP